MSQLNMTSLLKNGNNLMGFPMTMHGGRVSSSSSPGSASLFAAIPYAGTVSSVDGGFLPDLVVTKTRSIVGLPSWWDSARGPAKALQSSSSAAESATGASGVTAFTSTGVTLGSSWSGENNAGAAAVAWLWKKDPAFFNVVRGAASPDGTVTIAHGLTVPVGMAFIKVTSAASNWTALHRSQPSSRFLVDGSGAAGTIGWSTNSSSLNVTDAVFAGNAPIVAYIWGHNVSTTGQILCVSVTTDSSGNASFDTGWPSGAQFVKLRCFSGGNLEAFDTSRTPNFVGNDGLLSLNLGAAESAVSRISQSGSIINFTGLTASAVHALLLVRA